MKLVLFEYRCKSCGCFFKAPQISPHSYGEFLLRTRNSASLRYLDALASTAYSDIAREIKTNSETSALDEAKQTVILQAIFAEVACEPDLDGEPFHMDLLPHCPNCAGQASLSWNITDPIEFIEIEVAPATFRAWQRLKENERKVRIMESVRKCLPKTSIV